MSPGHRFNCALRYRRVPGAAWEATVYASDGGPGSCACPGFDEHCSTRHKSTHPCSPKPNEDLKDKEIYIYFYFFFCHLQQISWMWRSGPTSPTSCNVTVNIKKTFVVKLKQLGLWSLIKFHRQNQCHGKERGSVGRTYTNGWSGAFKMSFKNEKTVVNNDDDDKKWG